MIRASIQPWPDPPVAIVGKPPRLSCARQLRRRLSFTADAPSLACYDERVSRTVIDIEQDSSRVVFAPRGTIDHRTAKRLARLIFAAYLDEPVRPIVLDLEDSGFSPPFFSVIRTVHQLEGPPPAIVGIAYGTKPSNRFCFRRRDGSDRFIPSEESVAGVLGRIST